MLITFYTNYFIPRRTLIWRTQLQCRLGDRQQFVAKLNAALGEGGPESSVLRAGVLAMIIMMIIMMIIIMIIIMIMIITIVIITMIIVIGVPGRLGPAGPTDARRAGPARDADADDAAPPAPGFES